MNSSTFVGIKEFNIRNIKLFPNPSNDFTTITNLHVSANYSIFIFNSIGTLETIITTEFKSEIKLNLSSISPGIYTVQISDNSDQIYYQRLIVN
ncbi:MAG: T9SS type A sorting domain-containing protein [Crocinitomicaceae bacterium]|nr:T9SS type A sorting domain-containing protein [Crocinitomicaceae bacterium]